MTAIVSVSRAQGHAPASTADVMHLDAPAARGGGGIGRAAKLGVAVIACGPDRRQRGADLFVAAAAAQQRAQVVALRGEEAEEQLAFGGQAGAVAVAAEGL